MINTIAFNFFRSAKYGARSNQGDIVVSYPNSEKDFGIDWKGSKSTISVNRYHETKLDKTYKHMFQKLQDKADGILLNNIFISSKLEEILMINCLTAEKW